MAETASTTAKSLLIRIAISAIVGFLIAAFLVIIPGTLFMRPSLRPGVAQVIISKSYQLDERLHFRHYAPLKELDLSFFLLCLAQNEVDCLPFLLLAGCIGPALLIVRNIANQPLMQKPKDLSDQPGVLPPIHSAPSAPRPESTDNTTIVETSSTITLKTSVQEHND